MSYRFDGNGFLLDQTEQVFVLEVRQDGEPVQLTDEPDIVDGPVFLPDGRIASLWLGRPGNSGLHEIKVMSADGGSYVMALSGREVADIGIGCGGAAA